MGLQAKGISTRLPDRGFLVPLRGEQSSSGGGGVIGRDGEENPLPLHTDLGGVVGEWLEERGLCLFLLIRVVEEGRGLCLSK